ncbi:pentapeptide repeat-containing protein [Microcoleus sp. Pol11C1]|uniref:pentapeptide repeat-containing protein n=1 Tax=unclassified Microcoleus TaxID=2642155 RepID=UPI002FD54579
MTQENSEHLLKKIWKTLTTDYRQLLRGQHDFVVDSVDSINAAISSVVAVVGLTGAAMNPAIPVVAAGMGLAQIAVRWHKRFENKPPRERSFSDYVQLAAVLAYCKSFDKCLNASEVLTRIHLNSVVSEEFKQQIEEVAESSLDEEEARKTISGFPRSKLAEKFNHLLLTYLQQVGLTEGEAQNLTERVAWSTPHYISQALSEAKEDLKVLAERYRDRWQKDLDKYDNIDAYLKERIASKPEEKVFDEDFKFKDIYVSLKAKPLDQNGKLIENAQAFDLETWAKDLLSDQNKQNRVMFVEAGPGRGKSVFCRMFADWVRQHLHPIWTPVLIRLRDIPTLQKSFRETLKNAVNAGFSSDDGWLTDRNTRYLFFLDGFDELLMEGRSSGGLEQFLKQVGQFQRDCDQNSEMGHRVLITGRTLALQGIERQMPDNLNRVEIQIMDDGLQQQWLSKWEAQLGAEKTSAFQDFLQDECCPQNVKAELSREPLLLYLLAAMHRDKILKVEDFQGTNSTQAKILIYNQAVNWVLTEQRSKLLNRNLTELEIEDLRRILTEAGLCVVQSGGECAPVAMIEERLREDNSVKALLEEAQKRIDDNPLRNALAVFYLQQGSKEGSVEFVHKSFGEFLCAERLKESLEEWTEPGKKGRGFNTQDSQMDWEIYDLLGYGSLTGEIVEYLMGLLTTPASAGEESQFRPVKLFQRLEGFYVRWCEGEFIDAPPENLPQKKMRLLRDQLKTQYLGQRQIDIYAGLNVMILLLELQRYGQQIDELKDKMVFYPCGKPNDEGKLDDSNRLLRLISYSYCVGDSGFLQIVGLFLSGANLSGANLGGTELCGANLGGTELCGANLNGAELSDADLTDADLSGAHLSHAYLNNADLSDADFSGAHLNEANLNEAYLSGANLSGANLSGANLWEAYLSGANLSGANLWDADLSGADLRGANLSSANFRRADLSDADLSDADLSGADLRGADLRGADLSDADLSGVHLSGVHLSSADLLDAGLRGSDLRGANLSSADLLDAGLSGVSLTDRIGDVKWDENTNWDNVRGLDTAVDVPEALRRQLGMQ